MSGYRVSDYDFVVKIIQYLEQSCGVVFFITSRDFDILYNWWEKGIPVKVVKESLASVVERWKKKNKKIVSFSNFNYEVKKNLKTYLQFHVGIANGESKAKKNQLEELEAFLKNLPTPLLFLEQDLKIIFERMKEKKPVDLDTFYEKLVNRFNDDDDLSVKVKIFRRSLSPELHKPEIEKRYRLNYLLNRFNIPDLQMIAST
jgi:hypothetical protein